jgi:phage/plasmid-like protein (TIGR03299 family)
MSSEVETMAWAHEQPWHGIGNRVEGSVTVDEMLIAAGLNWEVKQHECWTEIDGKKVAVGRKALVRDSDGKILSVTGDNWKPFQNKEAISFFREYTEAGGATLETAGSLRGGKIVWGLARVATGFTINGNDHVKGYILLVSPHEVGQAITVRTTSVRVVCANTLAMAGGVKGANAEYRQSHVKNFDVNAAKATVQLVKEQIAAMKLEADALQSLKLSEYDTVRFLATFFQPMTPEEAAVGNEEARTKLLINDPAMRNHQLEGVLWATDKAPGATPGNGWGVLNGVTYWADHMAGRGSDARLFNSWLGDTGRTKVAVKQKLLEMV